MTNLDPEYGMMWSFFGQNFAQNASITLKLSERLACLTLYIVHK